jgi:hypothetical protein
MSPGRAAEVISPVASALDAAHAAGLLHRDVKPSNMLVDSLPGRPDHVYLSDFGLSKAMAAAGTTLTGHIIGTPDYISPEQIEGRPVIDGRCDQYALACSAFELLTGTPPFRRDESPAVMFAQMSEPPPALTSRRPDLPLAVDGVLARGLAKEPGSRYATCREFADDLRMALGFRPYDSGPQTAQPSPGLAEPGGSPEPAEAAASAAAAGLAARVPVLSADPGSAPAPSGTAGPDPASDSGGEPGPGVPAYAPGVTIPMTSPVTSDPGPARIPPPGYPAQGGYPPLTAGYTPPLPGYTLPGGPPHPPRHGRRPAVLMVVAAAAAIVLLAAGLTYGLSGSGPGPATVTIKATSALNRVTGYTYVVYHSGNQASASIFGRVQGAAAGEVVRLYAQQFPFRRAPVRVGMARLKPAGNSGRFQFQVTPILATRYTARVFASATASTPVGTSRVATVYVAVGGSSGKSPACTRPVCRLAVTTINFVPPPALRTEMAKPWSAYFAVALSATTQPPAPPVLSLGAGHPVISAPHQVAPDEYTEDITFTFTIGNDGYTWGWAACARDTEAIDGLGLPGSHGCGAQSAPDSDGYLG